MDTNYEKTKRREKLRHDFTHKKRKMEIAKCKERSQKNPYYIKDETYIYEIREVHLPERWEEERCFCHIKNGEARKKEDGTVEYVDKYFYKPTGRIIHYPEKTVKRKFCVGSKPCSPYLKYVGNSTAKNDSKTGTNRRIRRRPIKDEDYFNYQNGSYKKVYV